MKEQKAAYYKLDGQRYLVDFRAIGPTLIVMRAGKMPRNYLIGYNDPCPMPMVEIERIEFHLTYRINSVTGIRSNFRYVRSK